MKSATERLDLVPLGIGASVPPSLSEAVPARLRIEQLAREAVVALMSWAAATGRVRVFRASIAPDNAPSPALVASLGFSRVGEQIDPVDGLEWVFEAPTTPLTPRK